MIDDFIDDTPPAPGGALFDVDLIERLLQEAASEGRAVSYSELLHELGYRFTRPKMRALCKVLEGVDFRASGRGEPELAVLVVRENDRLPGQGWWVGRRDYTGPWEGPEARAFIGALQQKAFDFWEI